MSFDLILPYLRPIEPFILDDDISEIMVNPSGRIFIERLGVLTEVRNVEMDAAYLKVAVKNIARLLGDDISEAKPILDARLPDGSRVAAIFPPCSVGGTTLTIRKFGNREFSVQDLVRVGTLDASTARFLIDAVESKKNVLISGGTGSGKTTLLGALLAAIPDHERIILVEDTAEIRHAKPNLARFEARRANADFPEVSIRELIKASLRHRPDRVIVGEVRGAEAFDLLQALNTGHEGCLSTIHANTAEQALTRLANCVLQAGIGLPYPPILSQIGVTLDVIIQIERRAGQRVITEVECVKGFDHGQQKFELETILRSGSNLGGSGTGGQGSLPPLHRPAQAADLKTIKPLERLA